MVYLHAITALLCCVQYVTGNIARDSSPGRQETAAQTSTRSASSGVNQREGPECNLRKDVGNCDKAVTKYYFDVSTGTCREFTYTGCGGNLNNFLSIDRCQSRCICSRPKHRGRGFQKMKRYFYNKATRECELFNYNGSGGNENRFYSLSGCQGVCGRASVRRRCRQRPGVGINCNNNSTVQYYYDKYCECCQRFTYLGCGGNRNRFPTKERCSEICKVDASSPAQPTVQPTAQPTAQPKPALCYIHSAYGTCTELLTRYFYSKDLKRCTPFTYSGCGGNENNFVNLNMCKRTCKHDSKKPTVIEGSRRRTTSQLPSSSSSSTTTTPTTTAAQKTTTPTTYTTTATIPPQCKGAPDRGHCIFDINRFYYDNEFRICRLFVWSGCGGNSNRFLNRRQCNSKCMSN